MSSWRVGARVALVAVGVTAFSPMLHAAGDDARSEAPAAPPSEAQKKEAQTLFAQGVKLVASGDSASALTSFRAAYEKFPNYRVLYNIGHLCARGGDPACAVRAYEQYLRDGGTEAPAKKRAEVEAELQTLTRTVGTVAIVVNVSGAEVLIDDVSVGRSPLRAPVPVNVGAHKIVVKHDDKSVERSAKVAAGEATSVDIELPKDPPPAAVVAEVEVPDKAPSPPAPARRRSAVVPWAITGGFAVATVITGVLAASSYSTFTDKRDTFPVTREALDDAQGSARTLFLLTGLFGAITIVSAGVAGYFTFATPGAPAPPPRVGLAAGPRGILLQGTLP